MKIFTKALYAGLMISIGGTVYLKSDIKFAGALLFAVGLFAICEFGLKLYTGVVGYIPANRPSYISEVFITLLGNLAGCMSAGYALSFCRADIFDAASALVLAKAAEGIGQNLLLSIFCGMLMFIAVDLFRTRENAAKYLGIFLCVPAFIIAGFEHSIANAFYLAAARASLSVWLGFMPVCILGNALGGMLAWFMKKL